MVFVIYVYIKDIGEENFDCWACSVVFVVYMYAGMLLVTCMYVFGFATYKYACKTHTSNIFQIPIPIVHGSNFTYSYIHLYIHPQSCRYPSKIEGSPSEYMLELATWLRTTFPRFTALPGPVCLHFMSKPLYYY